MPGCLACGFNPVAMALKRVSRQGNPLPFFLCVELLPIDSRSGKPEVTEGGEQSCQRGGRLLRSRQRGIDERLPTPSLDQPAERATRTHLQQQRLPVLPQ